MPIQSSTFQIKVNEEVLHLTTEEINNADIISTSLHSFHLITNGSSINATVEMVSSNSKLMLIKIEGEVFTVVIQDELDQMLYQMGFGKVVPKIIKEIKAPMPGLVIEIAVVEGEAIRKGDKLLILEAMKMENSLQASSDTIIKKINVIKGQAVVKGQVLIELE